MPRALEQGSRPEWLPAAQRQRAKRTYFGATERRSMMKMEKGKQKRTVNATGVEMVQCF